MAAIPPHPGSYVDGGVVVGVDGGVVVGVDGGVVVGADGGVVVGADGGAVVGVDGGAEVGVVRVGAGVDGERDGFGDADFRTDGVADGLAGRVVAAAGTTIAGEYTRLEGDGEADLLEAVCLAEVGAVGEEAGAADRS